LATSSILRSQLLYQHATPKARALDHIYLVGSLVAISNAAGTVTERTNYDPCGGAINKTVDGVGYTGHVMDPVTGLTHMQQRYYDPVIGRFLSIDPVTMMESGDSRHLSRYVYGANNPYRFVDPDGRWFREFFGLRDDPKNPYRPIPGADRGDAIVVAGVAAVPVAASAGAACSAATGACAATVVAAAKSKQGRSLIFAGLKALSDVVGTPNSKMVGSQHRQQVALLKEAQKGIRQESKSRASTKSVEPPKEPTKRGIR